MSELVDPVTGIALRPASFRLHGRFKVTAADGTDLTPIAVKEQALLALLVTDPSGERSRAWLQAHLWSARGAKQAGDSLRQALYSIRKRLGPYREALETRGQALRFDPDAFIIDNSDPFRDFLEGMDTHDGQFDDWLTVERSRRDLPFPTPSTSAQTAPCGAIVLEVSGASDGIAAAMETFFVDCVARTLREQVSIDVLTKTPEAPKKGMLIARVWAIQTSEDQMLLRVTAENRDDNRLIWSGYQTINGPGLDCLNDLEVLRSGNELVDAILETIMVKDTGDRTKRDATMLGLLAIRNLFTMDEARVMEADRNLQDAYARDNRAVFLAWRAQLQGIQFVERHAVDQEQLIETGLQLATDAIQMDRCNSVVLAAVANTRLILARDVEGAGMLAQQGTSTNIANPLAWWARSAAAVYADRLDEAYDHARHAQALASHSQHSFWWDLQSALSAAVTGRIEEAITLAERCVALAPNFKPPLRYLIALYATKNELEKASKKVEHLIRLEPDFSPDRLANDPAYPVSLMRQNRLLDRDRVLDLC